MKILIATGIFPPEVGGPATLAHDLARGFSRMGHSVSVITYANDQNPINDSFRLVKILRKENKLWNYISYFRAVVKWARQADVVYSLDWFSAGVPLMIACMMLRKKYIVRVGGGYIWEKYLAEGHEPVTLKSFYKKGLYRNYKLMYVLIRLVLQRAHHVVFNSVDQKVLYEKYYKLPAEKTSVIFNVTPKFKFSNLISNYKGVHQSRDKEIVFAGRFIKMKNVESLIKAFVQVEDTEFKLILIGNGPTEKTLHQLVHELQLQDRVEFMPALDQQSLYHRIANSHIVVIPSWTDIAPNQVFECLSLGIPFLLTQENYLPIRDVMHTLTIDPASVDDISAKLNMLSQPDIYEQHVQSQKNIEYSHSLDHVLVEHLKLFKL